MVQAKLSLAKENLAYINDYERYCYRDKSALVRAALDRMKALLEEEELRQSATLYTELYAEDSDLRELTASAVAEWPE